MFHCSTFCHATINSTFYLQLTKNAEKLVSEDDEDPIVDNNEIDTNNNLDGDFALTVPRTYRSTDLKKWRIAPVVPATYGLPGEMGKITNKYGIAVLNNIYTVIIFIRKTG